MIKILSDSTCDLSPDLLERYDIGIIPLYVRLGDEEHLDGVDITPDEIFEWSDRVGETPKTAAPSMGMIMDHFSKYLDAGDQLVVFTISSSMSSSYNNCCIAAEELDAEDIIRVIDSENLSTGVGLLVIEAALMAKRGCSLDEIETRIKELRPLVRASFVVDTLVYLHRGGRCSGLAAMLGGALKLHPRIAVSGGAMSPGQKYRGKPQKFVMDYVQDMEADLKKARPERVFITHSGCDEDVVDTVREYLRSLDRFAEVLETRAGSVISSHCGPGTLGVLFIAEES